MWPRVNFSVLKFPRFTVLGFLPLNTSSGPICFCPMLFIFKFICFTFIQSTHLYTSRDTVFSLQHPCFLSTDYKAAFLKLFWQCDPTLSHLVSLGEGWLLNNVGRLKYWRKGFKLTFQGYISWPGISVTAAIECSCSCCNTTVLSAVAQSLSTNHHCPPLTMPLQLESNFRNFLKIIHNHNPFPSRSNIWKRQNSCTFNSWMWWMQLVICTMYILRKSLLKFHFSTGQKMHNAFLWLWLSFS